MRFKQAKTKDHGSIGWKAVPGVTHQALLANMSIVPCVMDVPGFCRSGLLSLRAGLDQARGKTWTFDDGRPRYRVVIRRRTWLYGDWDVGVLINLGTAIVRPREGEVS